MDFIKNRKSSWVKNLNPNYLWAVGINLVVLLLCLFFCDLKYEVSDDFVMATIMSGAYNRGTPNPHMIFVNSILGYMLVPFYKLFPQISWYFVCQLALLFFSFTLISYMFFEKNGKIVGTFLTVFMLLFYASDAYILVQFTKTAAVVVMCSSLVFIWSLFENRKKGLTIISAILCLFGTMVRFSTIYISGAFLILILFIEFGHNYIRNFDKKKYWKMTFSIVISGMALIVTAFSLLYTDKMIYDNNEEYKYFQEYNRARSAVVDASDHGYEAYREELEKIGVSENDYYALRSWDFSDEDFFSIERLEEIAKIIKEEKKIVVAPGKLYEQMQMRRIVSYPIVLGLMIVLVVTAWMQRKQWIYGGLIAAIAVVLEAYLFLREKVVYRVEYGIFLCAFLAVCYFWNRSNIRFEENKKELFHAVIAMLIMIVVYRAPLFKENISYLGVSDEYRKNYLDEVFFDSWSYDARKYRKVVNKKKPECSLIKEIEEHKENFYFLSFGTTIQTLYFEWSPFENVDPEFYENCQYFSGVASEFPGMRGIAQKYGIDNYFKSLVNDNIYIVDNDNINQKVQYLQEHYYPNARAEEYKRVGGYQIWKVYKE